MRHLLVLLLLFLFYSCGSVGVQSGKYVKLTSADSLKSLSVKYKSPVWAIREVNPGKKFIAGELDVFGIKYKSLPRRVLLRQLTVIIKMYDFQTKSELYDFYTDINEGGTPHTKEQLDRVRNLPRD